MKKLKIKNLEEVLSEIKKSDFTFSISHSLNPTWLLIDDVRKRVSFEYGDDMYPDYELVSINFLSGSHKSIDNHIVEFKAKSKPGYDYSKNKDQWVYGSLLTTGKESAIVRIEDIDLSIKTDDGIQNIDYFAFIPVVTETICRKTPWETIKGQSIFENDICFYEEEQENGDNRMFLVCKWIPEWAGFYFLHDFELLDYEDNGVLNLTVDFENFRLCNEDSSSGKTHWHYAGNIIDNPELLQK